MNRFMNRHIRIKLNRDGEFRDKLHYEDVLYDEVIIAKPNILQKEPIPEDREENIGVITWDSIPVGDIGSYYVKGVVDVTSNYFDRLAMRLLWINPNINLAGLNKMATFIHSNFIKNKGITKRQVLTELIVKNKLGGWDRNILNRTQLTFFKRKSFIRTEDKIRISKKVRHSFNSSILGELIHNSALIAIEEDLKFIKVSNKRVFELAKNKEMTTIKTMMNHIREHTVAVLEEHNVNRYFKTKKTYEKYKEFLELPQGLTTREISKRLGVSLSTINIYRNYE